MGGKFTDGQIASIPAELKARAQWVCWKFEERDGKRTKVPVNPKTGRLAKSDTSSTWASFDVAVQAAAKRNCEGIGFVFTEEDPYCGIDLDSCRDPDTGDVQLWAKSCLDRFKSYSEITPSAKGFHIIIRSKLPAGGNRKGKVECYDCGRFFTFTGNLAGAIREIVDRQDELNRFHGEVFGKKQSGGEPRNVGSPSFDDRELIEMAKRARNGSAFSQLWAGQWQEAGYPSQSEADQALCNHLAYWTANDGVRIDSLFRQSGLNRQKWEKRNDYRKATIDRAIGSTTSVFEPARTGRNDFRPPVGERNQGLVQAPGQSLPDSRIQEMNAKHAVILIGGKCQIMNEFKDPTTGRDEISFSGISDIKNFYATDLVQIPTEKGSKLISIAQLWLQSPERRQYSGIGFGPGKEIPGFYNLWKGFAVEPRPGRWDRNREHIYEIICNSSDVYDDYLLDWMARIVQDPGGIRPGVAIVMKGGRGTGKGSFGQFFGGLLGTHFLHLTSTNQVFGRFNFHFKDCLFAFIDEGFWAGDRASEGFLKALVTEPTIRVEPKGCDSFSVPNYVNLLIASNNEWIIPAGLDERRFFVLEVSSARQRDHEYFKTLHEEMNNGGREALLYDLLQRDISDSNLRRVPQTCGLLEQKLLSADSVTKFWCSRLFEGSQLRREDEWQTVVATQRLYDDYVAYVKNLGFTRVEDDALFSRTLRKICPGVRGPKRITDHVSRKRSRCLEFQPLEVCRAEFEGAMGGPIEWERTY